MKWMEPFLSEGHLSGKIVCPNKKCGAKLGNYDWAGVCCGCRQWVVPVCRLIFVIETGSTHTCTVGFLYKPVESRWNSDLTRFFQSLCGLLNVVSIIFSPVGENCQGKWTRTSHGTMAQFASHSSLCNLIQHFSWADCILDRKVGDRGSKRAWTQ